MSTIQPRRPERTAKDYAIEFGEYLARGAEQLLEAINTLAELETRRDDGDEIDDSEIDDARSTVSEFQHALRGDIYQFRSRRDRALAPANATHTPPPQPRQWPEVWAAIREWQESPTPAFAQAAIEKINRTITRELHAQVHLDRIARAEQETTERPTHHA